MLGGAYGETLNGSPPNVLPSIMREVRVPWNQITQSIAIARKPTAGEWPDGAKRESHAARVRESIAAEGDKVPGD